MVWDQVGVVVTRILSAYGARVTRKASTKLLGKAFCSLHSMFEPQESEMLVALLELLLCSAVCTCTAFPDLMPTLQEKQGKKKSKSPNKLKSGSTSLIPSENKTSNIEQNLKSQSDSGKGFTTEQSKIWVRDNPHLTSLHGNGDAAAMAKEQRRLELQQREAGTERRLLRKCLYEGDVLAAVCPFLACREENVQVVYLELIPKTIVVILHF